MHLLGKLNRVWFAIIFSTLTAFTCEAGQFWGGELSYKLLNYSSGQYTYELTFTIFRDCKSDAELDDPLIRIINTTDITTNSHTLVYKEIVLTNRSVEPLTYSNKAYCSINDPVYCADKITFHSQITLPESPEGYTIIYSGCCRNGLDNIRSEQWNFGTEMIYGVPEGGQSLTYYTKIPSHQIYPLNSSPQSLGDSIVYSCAGKPLKYSFKYIDSDQDSLAYKFGLSLGKINSATTSFLPLQFQNTYSIETPVSGNPAITIDQQSGMLSGTPTRAGQFAIVLLIEEYRNGQLINIHRKDFQLNIFDCEIKKSDDIINCSNTQAVFHHLNNQQNIYHWDFGVSTMSNDVSAEHLPVYRYPNYGDYNVMLVVTNSSGNCKDTTYSSVKIYPPLQPDFSWSTILCSDIPITFTDQTGHGSGRVISRTWKTINPRRTIGSSAVLQYSHKVPDSQPYPLSLQLVVKTDLGCVDSIMKVVEIYPGVTINAGPDKIITFGDSYSFPVTSEGATAYRWQPYAGLNNPFVEKPIVSNQSQTTVYTVRASNNGNCAAYDTVILRYMKGPEIYVPSAFTPDNNGLNDQLFFFPVSMDILSFSIYDRWGNRIFETTDASKGWDGKYKNQPVPAGIYIWLARLRDDTGQMIQRKGTLTLIR